MAVETSILAKYSHHLRKLVDIPHYEVTILNEVHQFGLLYMPSDMLYKNKYKYTWEWNRWKT